MSERLIVKNGFLGSVEAYRESQIEEFEALAEDLSSSTLEIREFIQDHFEQTKRMKELEQENEELSAALNDMKKEIHTLKNYKKVDVDHPYNQFF